MAIENQPIAPVSLNEEKPKTLEEQEFVEIAEGVAQGEGNDGFTILEDGSAVFGQEEMPMVNAGFNVNLAE